MTEQKTTKTETPAGAEAVAAIDEQEAPTPEGYGRDANLDYGVTVTKDTTITVASKDKPKRSLEDRVDRIEFAFQQALGCNLDLHPELAPPSWREADEKAAAKKDSKKDAKS